VNRAVCLSTQHYNSLSIIRLLNMSRCEIVGVTSCRNVLEFGKPVQEKVIMVIHTLVMR
jgi:hypothetical protein